MLLSLLCRVNQLLASSQHPVCNRFIFANQVSRLRQRPVDCGVGRRCHGHRWLYGNGGATCPLSWRRRRWRWRFRVCCLRREGTICADGQPTRLRSHRFDPARLLHRVATQPWMLSTFPGPGKSLKMELGFESFRIWCKRSFSTSELSLLRCKGFAVITLRYGDSMSVVFQLRRSVPSCGSVVWEGLLLFLL